MKRISALSMLASFALLRPDVALAQMTCSSLTSLSLPNTTIQSAATVPAGPFVPPPGPAGAPPQPTVPISSSFCRVKATSSPAAGSSIAFEVWLPAAWNQKLMGIGNSGANGEISFTLTDASLAAAVNHGYAAVGTDSGHTSSPVSGTWAVGAPAKIVDNATRSITEVTARAKQIVNAFYGSNASRNYFYGCSMGGRQGLMQAQRDPTLYDGIISGAPVIDLANLTAAGAFQAQQLSGPGSFPASKLPAIAASVRAECDAVDGLVDGLIDDPRNCDWDPHTIQCPTGTDTNSCLTQAQANALDQLYKGARRADNNQQIYAGLERGGEDGFGPLGWSSAVTGPPAGAPAGTPSVSLLLSSAYIGNVAFQNPNPFVKTFTFNFSTDLDFVIGQLTNTYMYNANNPDLNAFRNRGGKVLMYHGWSDPVVPPMGSVDYRKAVVQTIGQQQTNDTLRLFMAPGMEHCIGGTGPFLFDAYTVLEAWVEQGIAPERIVAAQVNLTNGQLIRTRPLCRYPNVARYNGTGNVNSAASFTCQEPD